MFSETGRKRLSQLVPLLASDKDGEVTAAARAIAKVMKAEGKDFHDLVKALSAPAGQTVYVYRDRPQPKQDLGEWARKARYCVEHEDMLSEREAEFVNDMEVKLKRYPNPTERQAAWLDSIWHRLQRKTRDAG